MKNPDHQLTPAQLDMAGEMAAALFCLVSRVVGGGEDKVRELTRRFAVVLNRIRGDRPWSFVPTWQDMPDALTGLLKIVLAELEASRPPVD